MEVLYPSFFSFTTTLTNATRDPSGEIWGSLTQTKLNKSFSVILRLCAKTGQAQHTMVIRRKSRRRLMRFPFGTDFWRRIVTRKKSEHQRNVVRRPGEERGPSPAQP